MYSSFIGTKINVFLTIKKNNKKSMALQPCLFYAYKRLLYLDDLLRHCPGTRLYPHEIGTGRKSADIYRSLKDRLALVQLVHFPDRTGDIRHLYQHLTQVRI